MPVTSGVESGASKKVRHTVGVIGIAGLVLAVVAGALGYSLVAGIGLLVFLNVPWLTVIAHLAATSCLSGDEKRVWRAELWVSYRSIVALWSYLFASDLRARTKGFAPYTGGV